MPAGSYLFFPKPIALSFIWNGFSVKASLKFEAAIIVLHKGILMKEFAITKNGPWQIMNYTSDYLPKSFPPSVRCFPTPLIIFFYSLLIMISFYFNLISDRLRGI